VRAHRGARGALLFATWTTLCRRHKGVLVARRSGGPFARRLTPVELAPDGVSHAFPNEPLASAAPLIRVPCGTVAPLIQPGAIRHQARAQAVALGPYRGRAARRACRYARPVLQLTRSILSTRAPARAMASSTRRLAAILAADIASYSRLMGADEGRAQASDTTGSRRSDRVARGSVAMSEPGCNDPHRYRRRRRDRQWIGEHLRTTLGAAAVLGFGENGKPIMGARSGLTGATARFPGLVPRRAAIAWPHGQ
jgi:hypothetical protein